MGAVFKPETVAQVEDIVRSAAADGRTLEVVGRGSRRDFGRSQDADASLDLSAFSGVIRFEPEELVLTCGPATPLIEIDALLETSRQQLAFEPPDLGPLWGRPAGRGSLGGALAIGLGGSRRPSAGAPRDHFLGFRAINGLGEAFAAGGRVVKNVTGYDLPKLMAGAFGTLGALTEVTVKVLPRPEQVRTVAFMGLKEEAGLRALISAVNGPYQVTAAAFLPRGFDDDPRSATLLRLESIPATVEASTGELAALLGPLGGELRLLDDPASGRLWAAIGSGELFAPGVCPVWRLSVPPGRAAATGEALNRAGIGRHYYDWGGGAIWVEGTFGVDGAASSIRRVIRSVAGHGHATLVRGAAHLGDDAEPFQPLDPALAALTRRVKSRFDPAGVFNPGRMYRDV